MHYRWTASNQDLSDSGAPSTGSRCGVGITRLDERSLQRRGDFDYSRVDAGSGKQGTDVDRDNLPANNRNWRSPFSRPRNYENPQVLIKTAYSMYGLLAAMTLETIRTHRFS